MRPIHPNQRWVGDTTEFVIGSSGKLYLAAVLDLFSRFIVGWAVSAVNDRHVTIKALEMALKRRCPDIGLLHHSDQGCTYASEDYQDLLEARGIVCSMSRRGNCWDNAVMESFFSTVKSELGEHFDSHGDAKMELFDYIEVFYPGFPFCRPLMAPLYTRDPPSPRDCFRRTIVQVLRPSLSPR